MARKLRSDLPDGIYSCSTRAVYAQHAFHDGWDTDGFRWILRKVARRHHWRIRRVALMDTRYHLLVECSRHALSDGMHDLNGWYAQRFNNRHHRHGHLWADRYAAFIATSDRHLANSSHSSDDNRSAPPATDRRRSADRRLDRATRAP